MAPYQTTKQKHRLSSGNSAAVLARQQVWIAAARAPNPLYFPFPSLEAAKKFRFSLYNVTRHIREDPSLDMPLAAARDSVDITLSKPDADGRVTVCIGRKIDSEEGKAILDMLRQAGVKVDNSVLLRNPQSEALEESARRVSELQGHAMDMAGIPQEPTVSDIRKELQKDQVIPGFPLPQPDPNAPKVKNKYFKEDR